jgi:hypothetical protein
VSLPLELSEKGNAPWWFFFQYLRAIGTIAWMVGWRGLSYQAAKATALTSKRKNMTLVQTKSGAKFGRRRTRLPVDETFVATAAALMKESSNHKPNNAKENSIFTRIEHVNVTCISYAFS